MMKTDTGTKERKLRVQYLQTDLGEEMRFFRSRTSRGFDGERHTFLYPNAQ